MYNGKTKYGAMGIAMLFVLSMTAIPGAAAAESCELSLPGDACTSASWIYAGEQPALETDGVAAGSFTVRIQELPPFTESYWVETTFTVVIVAGEAVISEAANDAGFNPAFGWPVELVASAEGLGVPSVTATGA